MNLNKAWEGVNWIDLTQVKENCFIAVRCSNDKTGPICGEFIEDVRNY